MSEKVFKIEEKELFLVKFGVVVFIRALHELIVIEGIGNTRTKLDPKAARTRSNYEI
ncbi:hypothetical protein D3C86_1932810 [compost metagenome]